MPINMMQESMLVLEWMIKVIYTESCQSFVSPVINPLLHWLFLDYDIIFYF